MTTLQHSPLHDPARLAALRATGLLDGQSDRSFEHLTRLAARVLGVRMAFVILIDSDRQINLSCWPPDASAGLQLSREQSFCQYVVASSAPFVVDDARRVPELASGPVVRELGVVAYAGVPLRSMDGEVLGCFSAADGEPREWTEDDLATLTDLASAASAELDRRVTLRQLADREARHSELLDQTQELVVASDAKGFITLVNRAWRETMGYTAEEARTINPALLVAPEHRAAYVEAAHRLMQGEPVVDFEAVLIAKDGRRVVCRGHASPHFEDGRIVGTSAVYRDVTEMRRGEHVRARLVATLEASPDFVAILGSDDEILFVNRAGRRLVGLADDDDLSEVGTARLRSPEEDAHLRAEIIPAAVRDGVWQGESSLLDASGTSIPVSLVLVAHPSTHPGEPPYFLSLVARDLRERLAAERARREAEDRFREAIDAGRESDRAFLRAVLENLSDGIVACDAEGRLTLFNRALREMHGLPAQEVPAERWSEHYALFHADGVTPMRMAEVPLFRALSGERVVNAEMVVAPHGLSPRTCLATGQQFLDADGRVLGAVVAMRDVTAQQVSERALRDSEERFRTVVENLAEGLVITDLDGTATYVNPRMCDITGYPAEMLLGHDLAELLIRPEARAALSAHFAERQAGIGSRYSIDHIRRDGDTVWVEIAGVPYRDGRGNVVGTVGLVTDISERRRWEAALLEAKEAAEQASRSKTEFLSRASHELRTPLNSVIGFSTILLKNRHGTLGPTDVSFVQRIRANGEHLLSLVNDLLDIAKVEAGHMTAEISPVVPYDLVHDVVSTLEGRVLEKGITLAAEVSIDLDPIVTDAAKLKQVLINLVGNAIKFTREGGVTVRVIGDAAGVARTIVVGDTGCGIPADDLPHIFDAFTQAESARQTTEAGTGLGLAICQSFCDFLGYTLRVESTLGVGTRFIVEL